MTLNRQQQNNFCPLILKFQNTVIFRREISRAQDEILATNVEILMGTWHTNLQLLTWILNQFCVTKIQIFNTADNKDSEALIQLDQFN